MTAMEIRNALSIYDNDMLNAACETERKEDLADEIAKEICKSYGVDSLYKNNVFEFNKVREILKSYGFDYCWSDDEDEEHRFINHETKDEISIFPITYYSQQGNMRFQNFLLN